MREYFILNRHKFIFQIIGFAIMFSTLWTIYFYIISQTLNIETKMFGYLISILILPFVATFFSSLFEVMAFKMTNKIFDNEPFAQLLKLNFKKSFSATKSKFLMSGPILTGIHNDYLVNIEMEKGIVRVIVDANLDKVEQLNINDLKKMFGNQNVQYDVGIAILYDRSKRKALSSEKLLNDIEQFIYYLKSNGINSWSDNGSHPAGASRINPHR